MIPYKYLKYLLIFMMSASLAATLPACGSSTGDDDDDDDNDDADTTTGDATEVTTTSASSTGDFTPSISAAVDDDGSVTFTAAAVDVDGDGTVGVPSITSVTASSGDTTSLVKGATKEAISGEALTCSSSSVSGSSSDIGICLDTTGSMGAASGVLAGIIADFFTSLETAGIDASAAGVTVGDAFDVKETSGSSYTDDVSSGSNTPPSFDPYERPSTGSTTRTAAQMATFFTEVESVVSTGIDGADMEENYLGCLEWLVENVTWTAGAPLTLISIGDNCSQTEETAASGTGYGAIVDPWIPMSVDDVDAYFAANTNAVHIINDTGSCGTNLYYMADLATATGGTFTDVGSSCATASTCNVDLTELSLLDAFTGSTVHDCACSCTTFEAAGTFTFTIVVNMVDGGTTYTATAILVIVIVFGSAC